MSLGLKISGKGFWRKSIYITGEGPIFDYLCSEEGKQVIMAVQISCFSWFFYFLSVLRHKPSSILAFIGITSLIFVLFVFYETYPHPLFQRWKI